ncbi:MAG: 40S ribosomal protein S22 [Marteilia pararefringens]
MKNPVPSFIKTLTHAEKMGKKYMVFPKGDNKNIIDICKMLLKLNYIASFRLCDDSHSGKLFVQLTGRINKVVYIRARKCKTSELDGFAQKLLPSRTIGSIILTTSEKGLVTHQEAIADGKSGKCLFAVY